LDSSVFQLLAEIEQHHWWFVARRRIIGRLLREALPPDPQRLVVDVGCGTGANIASLAGSYACVGIDASEDAIRHARARFPDVEFIRGDSPQALGERAGRVDALLMTDVLEHVEDDRGLLAAQLSTLRSGGLALLTVPADMRLWSPHDVSLGHHRRYDAASFRALWRDAPVEDLMLSHFNTRLYPAIRAVRLVGRLRGAAHGRAGTDMRMPPAPVNRILERVFAGESARLIRQWRTRSTHGYRFGVSLLAILRRRGDDAAAQLWPTDSPAEARMCR